MRGADLGNTRALSVTGIARQRGFESGRARQRLAGGESGAAIVPGKPDESLLLDYISGDKPEMPKNAPPLAHEQSIFAVGSRPGPVAGRDLAGRQA